jgi:aquaporin Z
MSNSRAILAELLGSFVLLFGGGMAIIASEGSVIVIAFGFGLALLAGLYAFGEVSGGHFNPAVSLGVFLDKRIDANTFLGYVVAQVVGAVLAGGALFVIFDTATVAGTATHRQPGADLGVWGAYLIEVILAAVFIAVILRVTTSETYGRGALVAISLTLVLIHLAAAPITGASVNPSRSLGSALLGNDWGDTLVWLTAPLVGAALGWLGYRAVHAVE